MAAQREAQLDQMPPDPAGRIKELQNYEFMDPEAWRMFQELLQSLRQQMLKPFMQGMQQAMSNMSPQDMQRMREIISQSLPGARASIRFREAYPPMPETEGNARLLGAYSQASVDAEWQRAL